jgi:hypothetical protein
MIDEYTGGRMKIGGKEYAKDLKLMGDRIIPNWWRERDHRLTRQDIEDILEWEPDVLVAGQGYAGNMHIDESLRSFLSARGIELVARETGEAVNVYNDLYSKGKKVAGVFHLTC